jgi:predicted PurR-regulated permease PerM
MVAALYFGREVLVPIALALLLSFVLAPLVRRLQSWRFPRIIAVSIVAIFAFAIIFGLGAFMVSQVFNLQTIYRATNQTLLTRSRVYRV